MRLREWDFDKQAFVLVDYPDAPIQAFVDFFRTTKAWVQDAERVHRQVLVLERALATHRSDRQLALAATAVTMSQLAPAPKRSRREVALANLAKARAKQAAAKGE